MKRPKRENLATENARAKTIMETIQKNGLVRPDKVQQGDSPDSSRRSFARPGDKNFEKVPQDLLIFEGLDD